MCYDVFFLVTLCFVLASTLAIISLSPSTMVPNRVFLFAVGHMLLPTAGIRGMLVFVSHLVVESQAVLIPILCHAARKVSPVNCTLVELREEREYVARIQALLSLLICITDATLFNIMLIPPLYLYCICVARVKCSSVAADGPRCVHAGGSIKHCPSRSQRQST